MRDLMLVSRINLGAFSALESQKTPHKNEALQAAA